MQDKILPLKISERISYTVIECFVNVGRVQPLSGQPLVLEVTAVRVPVMSAGSRCAVSV